MQGSGSGSREGWGDGTRVAKAGPLGADSVEASAASHPSGNVPHTRAALSRPKLDII